jgi:hypothetical protein
MLKRLFSVLALVLSFVGAPAAAQVFDFNLTFSGLAAAAYTTSEDTYTFSAQLTYDGAGNVSAISGPRLTNITTGGNFTSSLGTTFNLTATYNVETFALTSFNLNTLFSDPFAVSYSGSGSGSGSMQVVTSVGTEGGFTSVTSYTLGGSVISTSSGTVIGGNSTPVSVPEINGGTIPLLAFILSVVAMMLYLRNTNMTRNSGLAEQRTLPARST